MFHSRFADGRSMTGMAVIRVVYMATCLPLEYPTEKSILNLEMDRIESIANAGKNVAIELLMFFDTIGAGGIRERLRSRSGTDC